MGLPKELFVTLEHPDPESSWYAASLTPEDAVSGSEEVEPVNVGTYRLVEENELKLVRTTRISKVKRKTK